MLRHFTREVKWLHYCISVSQRMWNRLLFECRMNSISVWCLGSDLFACEEHMQWNRQAYLCCWTKKVFCNVTKYISNIYLCICPPPLCVPSTVSMEVKALGFKSRSFYWITSKTITLIVIFPKGLWKECYLTESQSTEDTDGANRDFKEQTCMSFMFISIFLLLFWDQYFGGIFTFKSRNRQEIWRENSKLPGHPLINYFDQNYEFTNNLSKDRSIRHHLK